MKISVRNFIITFAASLIIFGVAAYFIASFVTYTITDSIEGKEPVSFEIITQPANTSSDDISAVTPPELKGDSFSFAVIGTDYQPDVLNDYDIEDEFPNTFPLRRNRIYSADAVAVVRVDKDSRTILITSIPTNMRLEVDGQVVTLGEIYYEKGLDFFLNKLTALTGFELEKYFVIDVNNFSSIIDSIGAVTFNVPENMEYTDEEQKLKIELKKGTQQIDGKKAEQLLRFDNYVNPLNSRAKTTAEFIKAVADKLSASSFIEKATSLLSVVTKYTTTNYTAADLTANLELLSSYDELDKKVSVYPGNYITVDGDERFEPDIKKAVSDYSEYR